MTKSKKVRKEERETGTSLFSFQTCYRPLNTQTARCRIQFRVSGLKFHHSLDYTSCSSVPKNRNFFSGRLLGIAPIFGNNIAAGDGRREGKNLERELKASLSLCYPPFSLCSSKRRIFSKTLSLQLSM